MAITEAGMKLLGTMLFDERCNRWVKLRNAMNEDRGTAWPLPKWDGGKLAAARKLERAGLVKIQGGRQGRFLTFTEAGRLTVAG